MYRGIVVILGGWVRWVSSGMEYVYAAPKVTVFCGYGNCLLCWRVYEHVYAYGVFTLRITCVHFQFVQFFIKQRSLLNYCIKLILSFRITVLLMYIEVKEKNAGVSVMFSQNKSCLNGGSF